MIQAQFRGNLAREHAECVKYSNNKSKGRKIITKKHLSMTPKMSINKNKNNFARIYALSVFLDTKGDKPQLYYYLIDLLERLIYDSYQPIPESIAKNQDQLKYASALENYVDKTIPYIYVEDHLLLFYTGKNFS